jgi:hypothetical protein
MDIAIAATATAPPPAAKTGQLLEMLGAILGAAAMFLLIGKLRRTPPPASD